MLTMKYILKSQRLLEQYQKEEQIEINYLPSSNLNTKVEQPIVFKRGLKIDPETNDRYFDFID